MKGFTKNNIVTFLLDLLLSVSASAGAILFIRFYFSAVPNFSRNFLIYIIGSFLLSSISILLSKTHRIVFNFSSFKVSLNIILCATVKILGLSIPLFLNKSYVLPNSAILLILDFSATIIILLIGKCLLVMYASREDLISEIKTEKSLSRLNVVIFGTEAKSIAVAMRYQSSSNYLVKAFVTRNKGLDGKIIMDLPVIIIPEILEDFHVKDAEAILFATHEDMQENDDLVNECIERGICILTIPSTSNSNYPGLEVREIKHLLENKFIPDHMSGIERSTKRLIDLFVSAVLIVVFSPLMLLVAIIVKKTDGKPIIYKQERIGRFGRPFNILKFRTMKLDAESAGPALYSGEHDPRMTKTGKFLRLHHLDELPQLFNVFLGQMSFVGYRPERKVFIDKIIEKDPRYAYLYQIRPGVTSYATLKNGYTDTLEKMLKRLKYDLFYLNHRSILFDAKILWATFFSIAFGKKF